MYSIPTILYFSSKSRSIRHFYVLQLSYALETFVVYSRTQIPSAHFKVAINYYKQQT